MVFWGESWVEVVRHQSASPPASPRGEAIFGSHYNAVFLHRMDRFCLICAICVLNLNDIGEVYSDIYLLNGAYYAMMIYVKGERRWFYEKIRNGGAYRLGSKQA